MGANCTIDLSLIIYNTCLTPLFHMMVMQRATDQEAYTNAIQASSCIYPSTNDRPDPL